MHQQEFRLAIVVASSLCLSWSCDEYFRFFSFLFVHYYLFILFFSILAVSFFFPVAFFSIVLCYDVNLYIYIYICILCIRLIELSPSMPLWSFRAPMAYRNFCATQPLYILTYVCICTFIPTLLYVCLYTCIQLYYY